MRKLSRPALAAALVVSLASPAFAAQVSFSRWAGQDCAVDSDCTALSFGTVPTGHTFEITKINCRGRVGSATGSIKYWEFVAKKTSTYYGQIDVLPQVVGTGSNFANLTGVGGGLVRAPAGSSLTISIGRDISVATYVQMHSCAISGMDITP